LITDCHPFAGFPGTAEALAAQVTQENFDKGLIYPPFKNIRKISAEIAAKVAAKAYELGESFFLVTILSSAICSYASIRSNSIHTNFNIALCRFGYSRSSAKGSGEAC
jgi:hypothetical protein